MIDYSKSLAVIKEKSINHARLRDRQMPFSNTRIVQHPCYDFITPSNYVLTNYYQEETVDRIAQVIIRIQNLWAALHLYCLLPTPAQPRAKVPH